MDFPFLAEDWKKIRTCSRVAGNPCYTCQVETYFAHWYHSLNKLTLCETCYQTIYQPEKLAIEKATKEKEKQEQDALIADEKQRRQKGESPPEGWKRKDNFLISLKPASIFGVPYYQMVEIFPTLYDRETFKIPENPITFFQSYTNFSDPTQK